MQKLFLIFICIFCLPFGCSDVSTQEEDPPRGGFDDDSSEEEGEGSDRKRRAKGSIEGDKAVCEGEGYTLYLNNCPAGGGESGEGADAFSSADSEGSFEGWPAGLSGAKGRAGGLGSSGSGRPIDILFVINSNWTMYSYLHFRFKQKFKNFIPHLRGVDWRILVTNAYYNTKCVLCPFGPKKGEAMRIEASYGLLQTRYIDKPTPTEHSPDPTDLLLYTITTHPESRAYDGVGPVDNWDYDQEYPPYLKGKFSLTAKKQHPLRSLKASFSANQSLLREEADLVAIIVSHQDEGPHPTSPEPNAESLLEEFHKVYGEGKKLYLLNIIALPGDKKCHTLNEAGQRIAEVAKEIGGGNFSICLRDYSIVAKTISRLSN